VEHVMFGTIRKEIWTVPFFLPSYPRIGKSWKNFLYRKLRFLFWCWRFSLATSTQLRLSLLYLWRMMRSNCTKYYILDYVSLQRKNMSRKVWIKRLVFKYFLMLLFNGSVYSWFDLHQFIMLKYSCDTFLANYSTFFSCLPCQVILKCL